MPVQDGSQADQAGVTAEEIAEVPEQTTEEVSAKEEQPKEQTFTRAEVEAMLADFEKKVDSRIQSQVAKSENRTNQRIQERLAALSENREALQLTDEQYAQAEKAIIQEEQLKAFKPKSEETQAPAPGVDDMERFVTGQIEAVFTERGVRVTPDMPEFAIIQEAWEDPKGNLAKTLIATNDAAMKAAERMAALKGSAKARVNHGGGGTQGNQPKPKTAEEKISTGLKNTVWKSDTPQK